MADELRNLFTGQTIRLGEPAQPHPQVDFDVSDYADVFRLA